MKINVKVGNDNGNSSQKISFNGDIFELPNVYVRTNQVPKGIAELSPIKIIEDLHNNLFVTIKSDSLEAKCPQSYYVGNYTSKSGRTVQNMSIGHRGNKLDNELPIITTLANTAAYAVKKAYEKEKDIEKLCSKNIHVNMEMATALPNTHFNKNNAGIFRDNFLGEHNVTVYIGEYEADVCISIDYVKVMPEGVPTAFYLLSSNSAKGASEFFKGYDFGDKPILHVSIGDGTTDYPITEGVNFIPDFTHSSHNGIGIAAEKMIDEFAERTLLSKCSRQDISDIIRNKNHRSHGIAMELLEPHLEEEAQAIKKHTFQQLQRINNNVDFIVVYGGGSILLEPYLKKEFLKDPLIKSDKNPNGIELVYVPEDIATTIEAHGLYVFTQQAFFKELAAKYKATNNKEKQVS